MIERASLSLCGRGFSSVTWSGNELVLGLRRVTEMAFCEEVGRVAQAFFVRAPLVVKASTKV